MTDTRKRCCVRVPVLLDWCDSCLDDYLKYGGRIGACVCGERDCDKEDVHEGAWLMEELANVPGELR